ncbi:MAG: hypothetical protein HC769_31115, partial [Cyanobacteria bacterium CRU_2_1]|nr:hypothetical protein [Cyanobacteria bacterium CRU_2_1]
HLPHPPAPPTPTTIALTLATLLLIGRATLLAEVPFHQLGLALGICGWLLCWLTRRDSSRVVWLRAGMGLMALGWIVSVTSDPPWQAIAVSLLGFWLLFDRMRTLPRSATLIALFLIGLQAYGLLWRVIPSNWRQQIITRAIDIAGNSGMPHTLIGIGVFPYLLLTLGMAMWLWRQQQSNLAKQTEIMALILGVSLTAISAVNPIVRSINLLVSAVALAWVVWKRPIVPSALSYATHLIIVIAICSSIDTVLPFLSDLVWARILLGIMALEWFGSVGSSYPVWRRSAWHIGLALAIISYLMLLFPLAEGGNPNLIWLVTPVMLTGLSRLRQFPDSRSAAWLSTVALCAQPLLLLSLNAWMISLAVATGLMLVNTHTLRHLAAAALTIGFALGFEATAIHQGFADRLTFDITLILLSINLWLLWLGHSWLNQSISDIRQLYARASNGWAIALCILTLLISTGYSLLLNWASYFFTPSRQLVLASGLTTGAIGFRLWQQPTNLGFYGFAWSVEILLIILVKLLGGSTEIVAIVTLALGLFSQIVGDLWVRRSGQDYRASWHIIPLIYAGLGFLLAHNTYTASTGLYTLAAALIGIGIGRRYPRLKPLTLLAVLLVSVAAYELLIYQLLQAEAGSPGDGVILLAGLAAAIAIADRLFSRWLLPYLHLTPIELNPIAHVHWAIGSLLSLLSLTLPFSSTGTILWISITSTLATYALATGRIPPSSPHPLTLPPPHPLTPSPETWTYLGILETLIVISYILYRSIPNPLVLTSWAGAIASLIATSMYLLPWNAWGWSIRPWRNSAGILPILVILLTSWTITLQSLLIAAAFYAWFANRIRQIRLSYFSVILLDWAVLRFLWQQGGLNLLWIGVVIGGSLLYVAQIDPALQTQSAREQRHGLRSLATGLICLTAFYQAEVEANSAAFIVGLIVFCLGIGLIFAGLLLKVRAFLYIGTATFIIRVLRLLWLFINTYSLLLWAIGIILGLIFIWVAATFEARRNQMNALMQYWTTELESWD